MIQKDLGPVSAYALAVEQGYEGTEEEWATVQMNCARNAELAAEAKAGAELAKTGAETAKTAAQTAKTQAETARTEAQAARTGAEEAKEGAEEARDETLEALSRLPSTEEDKEWILGRGETHESTHLTTVGHAKDIYDDLNTRKADNGGVLRGVTADLANNLTDPDAQSMTEQFFIQNVNSGNTENGKSVLQIESIQGNSVILHQLVGRTLQTANGQITSTDYDNGDMLQYTFTVAEAQPGCKVYDAGITIPEGHKVYVEFKLNPYLIQTSASVFCGNVVSTPVSCTKRRSNRIGAVLTADGNSGVGVQFDGTQMVSHSDFNDITYVRNIQAFDLTRCYGKGNEPTAEEFRKRMRKPFYDKTEETLVGMNATGIACTGFNLWDGTWEKNTYYREVKDYSLYLNGPAERWVTNPIPVIPNTKYRISSQSMAEHANWAQVYDLECEGRTAPVTGEHIGGTLLAVRQLLTKGWYEFTVGPDATHMAFMFWDPEYGSPSPKPNDVCISRVLDSDRSMDYRKHERWVHELPIKTYFPNGMHGIGSVRDELTSEKAIKRCGIVDLESLTWNLNTQTGFYEADAPEDMLMPESDTDKAEVLAEKYTAVSEQDAEEGTLYLFTVSEAKKIGAKKTGGSGAPDGMAVYLLEEPVETTLPAEINLFFEADEYGTEEIVYEGETTPITMKFSHGTDFRGKLMTMDKEFQSQKSMRELLNTLGSVIGAPITQHWNEEEQKWTYEMG